MPASGVIFFLVEFRTWGLEFNQFLLLLVLAYILLPFQYLLFEGREVFWLTSEGVMDKDKRQAEHLWVLNPSLPGIGNPPGDPLRLGKHCSWEIFLNWVPLSRQKCF